MRRLFEAASNRPWKRLLLVLTALFFLWVMLPLFLGAPPTGISPTGAPFSSE